MNIFSKFFSHKSNLYEFKILFDISPSVIIRVNKKGYLTYANKTFEDIFGYSIVEFYEKIHVSKLYKGGIEEARKILKLMRSKDYGGIGKIINFETVGITRYKEEIPFLMFASIIYKDGKEDGSIGFLFDITQRKKLEEELKKQKERYKNLLDNASEGIYIRKDHEFKYFNKKFQELLGYTEEELKKLPYNKIIDESCFETCSQIYHKVLKGEYVKLPYESIFKRKDGKKIFVELNVNPVEFEGGIAVQGFVRDITEKKMLEMELKEANKKLKELSIRDELTGLYNYRYFREMLKLKYMESKRYKFPLSLILVDLDDFKCVNDTFGHLAGDFVLKNVATILQNNVRKVDIVARYGGDEFIIILPHATIDEAYKIGERILNEIKNKDMWYDFNKINISVSIGVSSLEQQNVKDENELLKLADKALYSVKSAHKGDITVFSGNYGGDCGRILQN